jgi:hypothetical protein
MGLQPLLDRCSCKCWPTIIEKFLGVDEVPAERTPRQFRDCACFSWGIRRSEDREFGVHKQYPAVARRSTAHSVGAGAPLQHKKNLLGGLIDRNVAKLANWSCACAPRTSSELRPGRSTLSWWASRNLQLSIGTILATDPRDIGNRPKSRDLQVSALYNFNVQPAMARPISSGESS